eukprot:COSAG01_NODE_9717_length_2363_cov_2.313163_2_plen_198_part_00
MIIRPADRGAPRHRHNVASATLTANSRTLLPPPFVAYRTRDAGRRHPRAGGGRSRSLLRGTGAEPRWTGSRRTGPRINAPMDQNLRLNAPKHRRRLNAIYDDGRRLNAPIHRLNAPIHRRRLNATYDDGIQRRGAPGLPPRGASARPRKNRARKNGGNSCAEPRHGSGLPQRAASLAELYARRALVCADESICIRAP